MRPSSPVATSSTFVFHFVAVEVWLKASVMSASCPAFASVFESVNGTLKTSGSVPPASSAAKVVPVHWYSIGLTMMFGFAFSNSCTRSLSAESASAVAPGRTGATVM